ncbi:MAG: hypothetical protein CMD96_08975 [Gammaproteobacteria bacterium]|nr:hypothetical protein [Gammaproteobacteria bacterium]HJP17076.1 glycosyltransferase family 1 protein [Nitrospinota bacterium]|tara:strand:- start:3560 stop:4663 length:1104 start_codon:yes stop_codon:yes gene_type:complete
MKIAIDARVISDKMHGLTRYAYQLIIALAEIDKENEYLLLSNEEKILNTVTQNSNFRFLKCNIKLYSLKEQFLIPFILKREGVEIYHSPTFSAPIFAPCKVVMTIHDMIHLIQAEHYSPLKNLYYKLIVKTAAQKSFRVITVSENSKKDIIRFLNVSGDKINSVYGGVDEKFEKQVNDLHKKEVKNKYFIHGKYILYIGNEKPHKNASNVIKAFDLFIKKYGSEYSIFMIGISREHIEKVLGHKAPGHFLTIKNISKDADLVPLYQASSLILFPSSYEGFGLPIIEGMACGIPVITSNTSSMPEVAGDAALMVDPENINQISDEIKRTLSDNNLRDALVKKGINRAKLFTWQKTAQKTLEVYKEVYS